jgi:hypothetical protein
MTEEDAVERDDVHAETTAQAIDFFRRTPE